MLCPGCQAQNAPTAAHCASCGRELTSSPIVAVGATLVVDREARQSSTPPPKPGPNQAPRAPAATAPGAVSQPTLLGLSGAAAVSSPLTESESVLPQPVLDVGEANPSASTGERSSTSPVQPGGEATRRSEPPPKPGLGESHELGGTRIGVPPNEMLDPSLGEPTEHGDDSPAANPQASRVHPKHTVLGVAQPGIAPLKSSAAHPGSGHDIEIPTGGATDSAKARDGEAHDWIVESSRQPGPRLQRRPGLERRSDAAPEPRPPSSQGWWLLGTAAALMAGLGVFAAFWNAPTPLTASIVGNEQQPVLRITCGDCPDETQVRLEGHALQRLEEGTASFDLQTPPQVGQNRFALHVERRGWRRDETIEIEVPVHFKVYGDDSKLGAERSELALVVEAVSGTHVMVEGQPLQLDSNGLGRYPIDLGPSSHGQSEERALFERRLRYTVKPEGGALESGELTLRARFAPLVIRAPGPSIVTQREHFMLAGETAAGGTVSVSGKPITVDPGGRFAQWMSVDSDGETEIQVRAVADGLAARIAAVKVKRVADLKQEAARFRKTATSEFAKFASQPEQHAGLPVALDGAVEDVRVSAHTTVLLMDVRQACDQPPCLARIVYGQKANLSAGNEISVFGYVLGATDTAVNDRRVPELRAEFVLQN